MPTTFTLHSNISEVYERLWRAGCNAARFWSEQPGMQPALQRRAQTARVGSRPKWVQMNFFAGKKKKRKLQCCQKELCGPLSHPLPTFGGFGVWLSMRGPSHPPWKRPSHTYQHRRIGSDCRTVWMYSTEIEESYGAPPSSGQLFRCDSAQVFKFNLVLTP